MVSEAKEIAYDTETSGLDWRHNHPVGYVLTADGVSGHAGPLSVYVPVRHGGGGNLLGGKPLTSPTEGFVLHDFEVSLAKAFEERRRKGYLTIGHHIKFDAHFSANAGIYLGRDLADTQNLQPLLDEYSRSFALAECAERHGVTPKKGEDMYTHIARTLQVPNDKNSMAHFWRLSGTDEMAQDYAAGDGVTTLELYHAQMEQIEKEELSVVAKLENDLIWTLFRMERAGMLVDEDRIETLRIEVERAVSKDIESLGSGFNVRSPVMMKQLMEERGHTDWPTTEKGNPSFTERWLKSHDTGRTIIDIRQKSNLLNSFVNPLTERHLYKGRVHATLNQLKSDAMGTISGRFSCNAPNLQQVPKRNKAQAIPFRRLFVADPGTIFWERDWSQCEPRLFAHYSGDKNLLDGYNSTPFRDAHSVVAELLKVERDPTAKRMNMGIFTGMQPKSFAGHMGWDLERATAAHEAWFREFSAIKSFQGRAKHVLKNRGYVRTLLGRKCRLEEPRFAYRGTSKIIQGSNADIAKHKLLQMDRMCEQEGDIVKILMTVHDSFNGTRQDTPEAKKFLDELVLVMEDVQSEPFNLRVPFVAEGEEGPDWAVASFGEKALQ